MAFFELLNRGCNRPVWVYQGDVIEMSLAGEATIYTEADDGALHESARIQLESGQALHPVS
jgi:hypothetical protein